MAYPGGLGSRGNSQLTYPRLCTSDLLWIVPSYKLPSPSDLLSQTPYPELFSDIFIAEQAAAEGKRPGREIKKKSSKIKISAALPAAQMTYPDFSNPIILLPSLPPLYGRGAVDPYLPTTHK
jgi:hypothetical protein